MSGRKNISASLNLFGLSSICSLSAIPVSSIHHLAGSGVFLLGIACNTVAGMMLVKPDNQHKAISPRDQFTSAAASIAMGVIGMSGASFMVVRDIVIETPVSFTSMGAGFAMATGIISFYGGLKNVEEANRRTALARQGMLSEP